MTGFEITAALLAACGLVAAARVAVRVRHVQKTRPPVAMPREVRLTTASPLMPGPMTAEEHWQRAAGTLIAQSERTRSLRGFQQAAASHLDAADYALQQLAAELAHVMPVTIASRASNVHHLPHGLPRNARRAGNAVAA